MRIPEETGREMKIPVSFGWEFHFTDLVTWNGSDPALTAASIRWFLLPDTPLGVNLAT